MSARLIIWLAAGATLAGCNAAAPGSATDRAARAEVEQLLSQWRKAFVAKDLDGVMSLYAPGDALTAFDVVPPLQYRGAAAYRQDYATFFRDFAGPLQVEDGQVQIEVEGNLALAYGLEHLRGTLRDGTRVDVWMRFTEGLRKSGGKWRIVHEHISVPADLAKGTAVLNLKP
jgi:ketosteroid isomerase-like protein